MSDFTPEQVERAAEALWFGPGRSTFYGWDELSERSRSTYRAFAEEVLSAAGAPERTPEFESREQELFKHQPVLSMSDGGVVGCQCVDRVFYRETEDWGTHLAEVFDLLSAAGAPEKPAPVVDEAALTEALERHVVGEPNGRGVASSAWCLCSCGYRAERVGMSRNYVRALALSHQATAVAAYLRGESK